MDVVRAAEQLSRPASQNSSSTTGPSSALVITGGDRKASAETKTTTVVLGKHTLAPQTSTVSTRWLHSYFVHIIPSLFCENQGDMRIKWVFLVTLTDTLFVI